MGSLKWTGWCGIAAGAIACTLFALPSTSWIVKTDAAFAAGRAGNIVTWNDLAQDLSSVKRDQMSSVYSAPSTPREELFNALAPVDHDVVRANLKALSDKHPDYPLIQAELGRYASQIVYRGRTYQNGKLQPPRRGPDAEEREQIRLLQIAAERGERSDPDNAHFPLLAAVAYRCLGDETEAWKALRRAAGKPKYNDYTSERCDLIVGSLKAAGIKGNFRLVAASSIVVFPYYVVFRHLALEYLGTRSGKEQDAARLEMLKLGETMADGSSTIIGVLVGESVARAAVTPAGVKPFRSGYRRPGRYYESWARELQARAEKSGLALKGVDAPATMRKLLKIDWAVSTIGLDWTGKCPDEPLPNLVLSAILMAVAVLIAPVALLFDAGRKWRSHEGAALALPLVFPVAVAAFWTSGAWLGGADWSLWVAAQAVLLVAAFGLAWIARFRFVVPWLVWGAMLLGPVGPLIEALRSSEPLRAAPVGVIMTLALGLSWFFSRARYSVRSAWVIAVVQIVGLTLAAAAILMDLAMTSTVIGSIVAALIWAFLAATFGPRCEFPVKAVIGPLLLIVVLAFGFIVRGQVASDKAMEPYAKTFAKEGDIVRDAAPDIDLEGLEKKAERDMQTKSVTGPAAR